MRKFAIVLLFLGCFLPFLYGQTTRFGQEPSKANSGADYPIKVHISGVHIRSRCTQNFGGSTSCQDVLYVDTVMDGKKIELRGNWIKFSGTLQQPIAPANYSARLLKDTPKTSVPPIDQIYELEFPNGDAWRCTVTGISE